ncbi:hypothetical protein MLD38_015990 [Melastoma candidum]|uniref:Uncharacterized protein n=1 Tax=Melastoma candidum TaxID=119954 RepID=A0ACB9RHK4_9MYRT|nr:hypothetical protein MLD38_015990 [Melastoma candidum]
MVPRTAGSTAIFSWDPNFLMDNAVEMEVLDENEWWGKMEQFKRGGEQEIIIRRMRNYSRSDQQVLSDMAYVYGLHFHAYNKGKALVVSKFPLPNYRADHEKHGFHTEAYPNVIRDREQTSLPIISGPIDIAILASHVQTLLCALDVIACLPRRISAISVAARISSERGEVLGDTVGYQIRLETKSLAQTRLLFCTTFFLIASSIGVHSSCHRVFLEDVLEKTRYAIKSESDNFQGNTRRWRPQEIKKDPLMEKFEDLDLDAHHRSYSQQQENLWKLGRRCRLIWVWIIELLNLRRFSYLALTVEATIENICHHESDGAVLVFLTGRDDISKLVDKVKADIFLGESSKFLVLPLHGSMPTINQRKIFDRPFNKRKIVLATNVAESSITIDDVVYVVDCGKAKETSYDALNKLACLLPSWISKASAHQVCLKFLLPVFLIVSSHELHKVLTSFPRRGCAGHVKPGVCYRLYLKIVHDAMPQYQLPEILRTPLQELCLHIKSLQLGKNGSLLSKAFQPLHSLAVAVELLKTIGALDDQEDLTPIGRHLCTLPLDPNIGKMLPIVSIFQFLNPASTIDAALAHRDPFVLPINRKEEADAAKRSFAGDSCSDHIALLKAFEGWKDVKRAGKDKAYCWENFLSPRTLRMMDDMRMQFLDLLSDIGFVVKSKGPGAYNRYSNDLEMVCAVLRAGLYPNVVQCKRRGKWTAFYTKEVGKVDIHPGSVNAGVHLFPLPY